MEQPGHSREVVPVHGHDLRSTEAGQHTEGCAPEHEAATPVAAPPTSNVKPVTAPIRTSARVSKKVKLDLPSASTQPKLSKKDEEALDSKTAAVGTPDAKRRRRNWGLWSIEDKNTFFEALNEYGKDFDAIQAHFAVKVKKRGTAEAKNKDQVRHFYYRNWHKISKFIKFSVELQKVTQELYALINFGELRKRMGRSVLDKNTVVKLHELIYHGFTLIKVRGKTVRVKTPLCRALRKLNQLDKDNDELPKLPPRVIVELRPLNNEAWSVVHATAQNPRARTSLPLQHRFSTLLSFLQHRWKHRDHKLMDKLLTTGETNVAEPRSDIRLRLAPLAGCRISLPSVNINENLTSTSLSLQTYEKRFLGNCSLENAAGPSGKGRNNCAKGGRGKKKVSEGEMKKQASKEEIEAENQSLDQIHAKAVEKILSLQLEGDDATDGDLHRSPSHMETEDYLAVKMELEKKAEVKVKVDDHEEYIAKIKAGWTLEDANTLTLGELYIMFGADGKLVFEYTWEPNPVMTAKPLPTAQETASAPAEVPTASPRKSAESVANLLRKLVSLAKLLPLIKEKQSCPCGHVCGKNSSRSQSSGRQRGPKTPKTTSAAAAALAAASAAMPLDPHDVVGRNAMIQATTVLVPNTLELPPGTTMAFQPSPSPSASYQGQHSPIQQPLQDGVFRRPLLAPSQFKPHSSATSAEEAFKAQLDQFRPKYCNRRGRSGRKNVVVQRMLPLLPKTTNGPSIMTLKMLPSTGEFRPISSQPTNARVLSFTSVPMVNTAPSLMLPVMQTHLTSQPGPSASKRLKPQQSVYNHRTAPAPQTCGEPPPSVVAPLMISTRETNNVMVPVAPPSPPSITALLGLGPEELSLGADSTTLLDVPLANPPNFVGLLGSDDRVIEDSVPDPCRLLHSRGSTPPISPTRILKESDNQWLNSEVVDFSLSSFLGHLDSPMKNSSNSSAVPANDDTRLSQDVEAQLQCLMSESSVDYMAKFADLAAQIASDTSAKK